MLCPYRERGRRPAHEDTAVSRRRSRGGGSRLGKDRPLARSPCTGCLAGVVLGLGEKRGGVGCWCYDGMAATAAGGCDALSGLVTMGERSLLVVGGRDGVSAGRAQRRGAGWEAGRVW